MTGLLLMGLLGVVAVVVGAPLVLGALCFETLRERAGAAQTAPRGAVAAVRREAAGAIGTFSGAAA